MGRFYLMSDVHSEFKQRYDITWPADAETSSLVLAGDIGLVENGSWAAFIASEPVQRFKRVYVCLGNHEFYNMERVPLAEVKKHAAEAVAALPRVVLLDRKSVLDEDGVLVCGTTLWSDVASASPREQHNIRAFMMDFRRVFTAEGERWGLEDYAREHREDAKWLEATKAAWGIGGEGRPAGDSGSGSGGGPAAMPAASDAAGGGGGGGGSDDVSTAASEPRPRPRAVLVVTHHGPLKALNPAEFADSPCTPAFVSELPHLLKGVDVWCSGHTHGRFDFRYEPTGTRVLVHCAGYHHEQVRLDDRGPYVPLAFDL